jgi:hypothetical protein
MARSSSTTRAVRDVIGRFGRLGGWKARYRAAPGTTSGLLVLESRVDVFESAGGAKRELAAFRADSASGTHAVDIGDGGARASAVQAAFPRPVRIVVLSWRRDNAVATVTVNGVEGTLTDADVLELAEVQDARFGRVG